MISMENVTGWGRPDKELHGLLARRKAVRCLLTLLSAGVIFVVSRLASYLLRYDPANVLFLLIGAFLTLGVFAYYHYKAGNYYGRRSDPCEDEPNKVYIAIIFSWVNFIAIFPVLLLTDAWSVPVAILAALMALLTYYQEWFTLILFMRSRYTVKEGCVLSRSDSFCFIPSAPGRKFGFSSTYTLLFEDKAGNTIPVMTDFLTYLQFRGRRDAVLIQYSYGKDEYLFEICRK